MPKDTPQVDHKAEAAEALRRSKGLEMGSPAAFYMLLCSFAHSNLVVAEGQERVAEETASLREEVAGLPEAFRVYLEANRA